jgi:hypothetical protein
MKGALPTLTSGPGIDMLPHFALVRIGGVAPVGASCRNDVVVEGVDSPVE